MTTVELAAEPDPRGRVEKNAAVDAFAAQTTARTTLKGQVMVEKYRIESAMVGEHVVGSAAAAAPTPTSRTVEQILDEAQASVLLGRREAAREEVIGRSIASAGAGLASGCWYLALGLTGLAPMELAVGLFTAVLFSAAAFFLLMMTPVRHWKRDRDLQTSVLVVSSSVVLIGGHFLEPIVRTASLMWMAVGFTYCAHLYPTAALLRRSAVLGVASAVFTAVYVQDLSERDTVISWLSWCAYIGFLLLTSQVAGFFRSYRARTHRSRAVAEAALASISEAVLLLDPQRRILSANRAAYRMLGDDQTPLEQTPFDAVARLERFEPDPLNSDPISVDERLHRLTVRDGRSYDVEVLHSPLASGSGRALGEVMLLRDVSATHRLMRRLEHEARHDALTGLNNRSAFLSGIPQRLLTGQGANAGERHASLVVIDLDEFKLVNDACGHTAGDQLLRDIATVLRARLGPDALIARLGGDEFAALIRSDTADGARVIARRLLEDIDAFRFYRGQQVFRVRASAGMAAIALDAAELVTAVDNSLVNADAACYLAKELGRNRLHLFSSGDDEIARKRRDMSWAQEIRRAIEQNRFVLMGQRIAPSNGPDEDPSELEVLLRLIDADGNLVAPCAFLPAAERFGLMRDIDQYVIRQAVTLLAAAPLQSHVRLSINLSAASVQDETLAGRVRGWLAEAGVSGTLLCFEMTETAAVGNIAVATATMNGLRALGCRLALDDVGSGFNSFSYLRALDVDRLKIDGSFVKAIANGAVDRIMVDSLYQIAQAVGIETVAEMVENPRLVDEVRAIGIEYMQGFAIHRPEPLRGLLGIDCRPADPQVLDPMVTGAMNLVSEDIGLVI